MIIVSTILIILAVYLFAGLVFAIPFIAKGVTKIDEGAHGATWGFKIIILPGTIVFWPFLLNKWIKALKQKEND